VGKESSMLTELSIEDFSKVLGSDSPAPGGGSVAALSGALGADLVCMVCRLSVSKPGLEQFSEDIYQTLGRAEQLSKSLLGRVDRDTNAFNDVMAAFKLPKNTDDEKKKRTEAIQRSYREAVMSPLGVARECTEVLTLAAGLLRKSNSNALSDLGVASQQAYAGLEGAVMNIKINLPSIKDEAFRSKSAAEMSSLLKKARDLRVGVEEFVSQTLQYPLPC
jgi:methenyltetrahydrofolate cyclohydrolase